VRDRFTRTAFWAAGAPCTLLLLESGTTPPASCLAIVSPLLISAQIGRRTETQRAQATHMYHRHGWEGRLPCCCCSEFDFGPSWALPRCCGLFLDIIL